jgi:hypothetical protein
MKRFLILAAVVAGLLVPATAGAAVPCRDRIYNDWYHDGRIASSYPTSCYRDALKNIPTDAKVYSSLTTDIRSAMLASLRRQQGKVVPKEVGRGFKALGHGGVSGQLVSLGNPKSPPNDPGTGGGIADTASSAPLPILVLGGIALALAAAGAVGTGVRYARRRRPR